MNESDGMSTKEGWSPFMSSLISIILASLPLYQTVNNFFNHTSKLVHRIESKRA